MSLSLMTLASSTTAAAAATAGFTATERELIGESRSARELRAFIARVGPTSSTVLLLGESGTGKELIASALHRAGPRSCGPFVAVNCAALAETLLESELFGHERGAFTGATEKKIGRFELAEGGTLFLDEIGELRPSCQSKFLRVLEAREFERVGGVRGIATNARVIAATNRNLEQLMQGGQFREDLYYRLAVIQTEVAPLRARVQDIEPLAWHFLSCLAPHVGRHVSRIEPEALEMLVEYSWPGNARELRNAIERALVLGDGDCIRARDLPAQLHRGAITERSPAAAAAAALLPKSLRDAERDAVTLALAATRGNKSRAATLLEIDRTTLYKKLKDYGLEV